MQESLEIFNTKNVIWLIWQCGKSPRSGCMTDVTMCCITCLCSGSLVHEFHNSFDGYVPCDCWIMQVESHNNNNPSSQCLVGGQILKHMFTQHNDEYHCVGDEHWCWDFLNLKRQNPFDVHVKVKQSCLLSIARHGLSKIIQTQGGN